jgi:hypothetical protein
MTPATRSTEGSRATVEVLYLEYHEPPVTTQKIWIQLGSLQRQMFGEPYTLYRIWSHHSWLKGWDHQPKRTKHELDPY